MQNEIVAFWMEVMQYDEKGGLGEGVGGGNYLNTCSQLLSTYGYRTPKVRLTLPGSIVLLQY